ncbi:hypothetical protein A3Q56_05940 [Intoshia linei]|uniref:RRM domain-containing protein n=1 Tax=Intoshia linei TaxID=1819745 RepID=A0A177AWG0_9BILA|nr:hypothetical protein A3Q56_05940 [Intoshia linei]
MNQTVSNRDTTLIIKHLPNNLTDIEIYNLLKIYKVIRWRYLNGKCKLMRNTLFALFGSIEDAWTAIHSLHQVKIVNRRISVEFANYQNKPNLYFTMPCLLRNEKSNVMLKEKNELEQEILSKFGFNELHERFINFLTSIDKAKTKYTPKTECKLKHESDSEWEWESDSNLTLSEKIEKNNKYNQEKRVLPYINNKLNKNSFKALKRYYNVEKPIIPIKIKKNVCKIQKIPHIEINCSKFLKSIPLPIDEYEPRTKIQKFGYENVTMTKKIIPNHEWTKPTQIDANNSNLDSFRKSLKLLNFNEMSKYDVFKRYKMGKPSKRLYIKNISKMTTDEQLHLIFGSFIDWTDKSQVTAYDLLYLKKGRLRGQCFVSLPSIYMATKIIKQCNGLILHEKPMVVQFSRSNQ